MKRSRFPEFTERFRQLQGTQGDTEFAKELGIARQTVGQYKNGNRIPDALVLRDIVCKTGVPADWLIGLTDDTSRTPSAVDELHLSEAAVARLKEQSGDKELMDLFSRFVSSITFWRVLSDVLRLEEYPAAPDEQIAEKARTKAETDFLNKAGVSGALLYGDRYKAFLRSYIAEQLINLVK